jgi:hypothetical protein
MKILTSDIEPDRVNRAAEKSKILFSYADLGILQNQGFIVKKLEMRQYVETFDARLGEYSLLTILIETDRGILEMKYDEGFRGEAAIDSAVTMIVQHIGLTAIINRALIELERQLSKQSL